MYCIFEVHFALTLIGGGLHGYAPQQQQQQQHDELLSSVSFFYESATNVKESSPFMFGWMRSGTLSVLEGGQIVNSTFAYPWRNLSRVDDEECQESAMELYITTSTFWVKASNGEIGALCQTRVLDQG